MRDMIWRNSIRFIVMACWIALLPSGWAEDNGSWVGKKILTKKNDIKIGNTDENGQTRIVATLTDLDYMVEKEEGEFIKVLHRGAPGWFSKEDAVLMENAVAYFTGRIRQNEKDTRAYACRGLAWKERGEYELALQDFNEAIRLEQAPASWFNNRGTLWRDKKDYDRAIRDYDEAIRLNPKKDMYFYNRGLAWNDKKDYDRAIRDFDEAIRLEPKYVDAFNDRGLAWRHKKDYDRAIRDYDEAIRLEPTYVFPFNNRGNAWRDKKDYDRAIRDYDEAIRLNPKYALAHLNLSVTQMLTRRPEAVAGFQRVLDLEGWKGKLSPYAVILGHLAARQMGDESAAKRFLKDSVGKLNESWPYPAVRFLRHEIDEPALLKLADNDDKRTEARCFLGLDCSLKDRKDEALANFRWVKEHGNPRFVEYTIALAELARLERPSSGSKP
jgi:tetratricopeptide (TPR) repeat protein